MNVPERRLARAVTCSLSVHLLALGVLSLLTARAIRPSPPTSVRDPFGAPPLVWLLAAGAGGGGGGGGAHSTNPPSRAYRPGRDAATITAAPKPPAAPTLSPTPSDDVPVPVVAPIVSIASGVRDLPGAMDAPPSPIQSPGPGGGGGAGTGNGTGDGPGNGRGLGPGPDHGTGDGPSGEGAVTPPVEIRKGTPQYTLDAMRARAEGSIRVQCVVQTTGVCADIRVLRTFTPAFGLDQEAIKAAAQWRFRPAMRRGQPVPVVVSMEIVFALR